MYALFIGRDIGVNKSGLNGRNTMHTCTYL